MEMRSPTFSWVVNAVPAPVTVALPLLIAIVPCRRLVNKLIALPPVAPVTVPRQVEVGALVNVRPAPIVSPLAVDPAEFVVSVREVSLAIVDTV